MTAYHDRLIDLGVRVIGGCCGTTPAHIRAMREALAGRTSVPGHPARRGVTFLSSRSAVRRHRRRHPWR